MIRNFVIRNFVPVPIFSIITSFTNYYYVTTKFSDINNLIFGPDFESFYFKYFKPLIYDGTFSSLEL